MTNKNTYPKEIGAESWVFFHRRNHKKFRSFIHNSLEHSNSINAVLNKRTELFTNMCHCHQFDTQGKSKFNINLNMYKTHSFENFSYYKADHVIKNLVTILKIKYVAREPHNSNACQIQKTAEHHCKIFFLDSKGPYTRYDRYITTQIARVV
jgi:hypothetical protein